MENKKVKFQRKVGTAASEEIEINAGNLLLSRQISKIQKEEEEDTRYRR